MNYKLIKYYISNKKINIEQSIYTKDKKGNNMIAMAIKYIILPEKKMVTAILSNTRWDAYNKALKMCRKAKENQSMVGVYPEPTKLMMNNEFKITVKCDDLDTFDIAEGKRKAKERLLRNYYKSFDKKINMFRAELETVEEQMHRITHGSITFINNEDPK